MAEIIAQSPNTAAAKPAGPLSVRNFRLLWSGEGISLLGDQFALIALPWLVLQLTGDALALGAVMALAGIPRALFMLIGGAFVDRFSPRVVMFASNLARMLLVAALSVLVLTGEVRFWMLYVFALSFGLADAFYFPGQSAIVPQILETDQLQAGNALVQGTAQLSLFLGPVLAGGLIALFGNSHHVAGENTPGANGIGAAFAIDALSFLASLWALWRMRICKPHTAAEHQSSVLTSIKEGLTYVWDSAVLRMLFVVMMAVNFLVIGPFEVGIPVMADTRLSEGAAAYGIIMSAFGGGALIGIILAGVLPRPKPARFGAVLLILTAYLGLGLILLPLSSSIAIVALIGLSIGVTNGYVNISLITWLQKHIPDVLMGRIMSLMMFAGLGVAPISAMLAGALLHVNLDALFIGAGLLMAAVALATITMPVVRQMGLEVPESNQTPPLADARRRTGDLPALRSTHEMPVVKP